MNLKGVDSPPHIYLLFPYLLRTKMDCIMPRYNKSRLGKSMGVRWRRLRGKDQHIPVAYGSTFFPVTFSKEKSKYPILNLRQSNRSTSSK
jgi:hypothetical protein